MKAFFKYVFWVARQIVLAYPIIIIIITLCLMCCGCRSSHEMYDEDTEYASVLIDSTEHYKLKFDSVMSVIKEKEFAFRSLVDSVNTTVKDSTVTVIETRNDTVYVTSTYWHNEYNSLFRDYTDLKIKEYGSEYTMLSYNLDSIKQFVIDSTLRSHVLTSTTTYEPSLVDKYRRLICYGITTILLLIIALCVSKNKGIGI